MLHGVTQEMEENGTKVAKWGREEEKKKMEEEQGKSVHENNIMGEAIFKTLQYTQRIRLFEKKDHFNTWEREKEKDMIVSSLVVASTWDRGLFSTMRKRWIVSSSS